MENRLIVQVDISKRVQPIEHQINMVTSERSGVDLECSLIFPVGQADPLQTEFVVPIEWVGDETILEQVGVHHARNLRRMPLLDVGIVCVSDGAKLPTRIQRARRRFGRDHRQRDEQQKYDRGKTMKEWRL